MKKLFIAVLVMALLTACMPTRGPANSRYEFLNGVWEGTSPTRGIWRIKISVVDSDLIVADVGIRTILKVATGYRHYPAWGRVFVNGRNLTAVQLEVKWPQNSSRYYFEYQPEKRSLVPRGMHTPTFHKVADS